MAGICEGRVAIVTGAGRGIGREHALMLASEGAAVVVNDLGAQPDGEGADPGPANEVVAEIEAMGGKAVVNGANVADFDEAGAMVQQAIDTFGKLDILVNNAGILRDRMIFSMSEADWDAVIAVHLKGHFCPTRHAAAYWRRAGEGRQPRVGPDHQHRVGVGALRQRRPGQLRRRQGRHRRPSPTCAPSSSAASASRRTASPPWP